MGLRKPRSRPASDVVGALERFLLRATGCQDAIIRHDRGFFNVDVALRGKYRQPFPDSASERDGNTRIFPVLGQKLFHPYFE